MLFLILQYEFAFLFYFIFLAKAVGRYPGKLRSKQKKDLIAYWRGYQMWVTIWAVLLSIGGLLLWLAWVLDGGGWESQISHVADFVFPLHDVLWRGSDLLKINAMAVFAWATFFLSLPLIFISALFQDFNPRVSKKHHYRYLFSKDDEVIADVLPPAPLLEEAELEAIDQFVNDLLQKDQTNPEGQA